MRLLSPLEERLCIKMLDGLPNINLFPNIINDEIGQCVIYTESGSESMVEIGFVNEKATTVSGFLKDEIRNEIIRISRVIITAVSLIQLLEKEGYILLHQTATFPTVFQFGPGRSNNQTKYVGFPLPDVQVRKLVIEYLNKDIIVTDEFRRFCSSGWFRKGFIARDEQRFRRQITIAYSALFVATIVGAINAGINIHTKFYTTGTKINQAQIDTLVKSLKVVGSKTDSLDVYITKSIEFVNKQLKAKNIHK